MSIIYNDLQNDFTLIPNIILQDTRISGLAFKIYSYIAFRLGRNKEWEFYNREIISHFKEGRDSFMKAKNELLQLGYLEVVRQNKSKNGKFLGNDYIIRKNPINPLTENPSSETPYTENQFTNNKEWNKKNSIKKDCNAMQEQCNFSNLGIQSTPNNSQDVTFEDFKAEWNCISSTEPLRGFEAAHRIFQGNWQKLSGAKRNKYKDWSEYLKQWIAGEFKNTIQPTNLISDSSPPAEPLSDCLIEFDVKIHQEKINESARRLEAKPDVILKMQDDFQKELQKYWGDEIYEKTLKHLIFWEWSEKIVTLRALSEYSHRYATHHLSVKIERILYTVWQKYFQAGFLSIQFIV